MFLFKLCSVLVILITFANIQPTESAKHTGRIKTIEDLKAHPKTLLKSIDKYVTNKTHSLKQIELISEFWRSKSLESNQDTNLYVQNPLNCLKILTTLVVDLDLLVKNTLDEVNTRFEYEEQLVAVDEGDLNRAARDLAVFVLEHDISWQEFIMTQDRMDSDDKVQFLKWLQESGLMSTYKSNQLTKKILHQLSNNPGDCPTCGQ